MELYKGVLKRKRWSGKHTDAVPAEGDAGGTQGKELSPPGQGERTGIECQGK